MHGQVRVESSPAGGARLVVTLPVLARDGEPEEPATEKEGEDEVGRQGEGANGAGRTREERSGHAHGIGAEVGEEMLE
jgi:hypothetical protein